MCGSCISGSNEETDGENNKNISTKYRSRYFFHSNLSFIQTMLTRLFPYQKFKYQNSKFEAKPDIADAE